MNTLGDQRMFQAVGIAVVAGACAGLLWHLCIPDSLPLGAPSLSALLVVILTVTAGHELLHMLGFPRCGFDANTVTGIWPQAGAAYAQFR